MEDFLWGVATAAYQVEGGLNGPGRPQNNWAVPDAAGTVEPVGEALSFWAQPDELLGRAAAMACNAFRLSLEWARVEPEPGVWDEAALDGYAAILHRTRELGMEPVVTLQHFTHPAWCGPDFWLLPDAPQRFEGYVRRVVSEIGRRAVRDGDAPVRWWITINEPVVVPVMAYVLGRFPSGGRSLRNARRAFDHILAAHVRGYDAVHDVYEQEGWAAPLVTTNTISFTAPALDADTTELLLARERGVDAADVAAHLRRRSTATRRRLKAVRRRGPLSIAIDTVVDRATQLAIRWPRTVEELYESPRARKLDYLSFDLYDPVIGNFAGPARAGAGQHRETPFVAELWEQEVMADAMATYLRLAHLQALDRPILVAENGLATPNDNPRADGWSREEFLKLMCAEVVRARDEGVRVAGYIHWTIADNYEWGSYKPRFGIHGVDRRDGVRILDTDAVGADAAGAYRRIIEADRS
jgi:beta-glucosidase